jgi:hypothetical protein
MIALSFLIIEPLGGGRYCNLQHMLARSRMIVDTKEIKDYSIVFSMDIYW